MTKQEMFTRAVRGLRSQGWERCGYTLSDGEGTFFSCHTSVGGRRCAWGWVDTTLTEQDVGGVRTLAKNGVGLAPSLRGCDLDFAEALQIGHDTSRSPGGMEAAFRKLGEDYNLEWPNE